MAQIDPSIALGFRPIQIESPINQMSAIAQLQGAQQQQQMNALKLQEYKQQQQERNELARIMSDPNLTYGSDAFMNQVLARAPGQFETIATRVAQREDIKERTAKREFETQKLEAELKQKRLEEFKTAQKDIAGFGTLDDAKADIQRKLDAGLLTPEYANNILAGMPKDPAGYPAWQKRTLANLVSAEKQIELFSPKIEKVDAGGAIKFIDINPNSSTFNQEVGLKSITKTAAPAALTESNLARLERERAEIAAKDAKDPRLAQFDAAIAKETGGAPTDIMREYKFAMDNGQIPKTMTLLQFKERLAQAGRSVSVTQAAPTITMVLDPSDNTRMLSVNAREYRGGSLGSPGVIGIAGKEPTVGKKQEAREAAQKNAETTIAQLRQSYARLDELGGITSTQNRAGTNISARMGASPMGQTVGSFLGTKTQAERDKIEQTRPLLMTTIMQAMGLSAKQLDSNAELKLWLSSATDPTKSLEANREALDNLENMLTGKESKPAPKPAAPKPKSDVRSKADAILGQ